MKITIILEEITFMKKNSFGVLIASALLIASLSACGGEQVSKADPPVNQPVATSAPTEAAKPTEAPKATNTAAPTEAPKATVTPVPTEAPKATETPVPTEAPKATEAPAPTDDPYVAEPTPTVAPTPTLPPLENLKYADEIWAADYDDASNSTVKNIYGQAKMEFGSDAPGIVSIKKSGFSCLWFEAVDFEDGCTSMEITLNQSPLCHGYISIYIDDPFDALYESSAEIVGTLVGSSDDLRASANGNTSTSWDDMFYYTIDLDEEVSGIHSLLLVFETDYNVGNPTLISFK